MPLYFHIPLPGPFSYSARVSPRLGKAARTVGKVASGAVRTARTPPPGDTCRCARPAPPRVDPPSPPSRPVNDIPSGAAVLWGLGIVFLALVVLAVLVGVDLSDLIDVR